MKQSKEDRLKRLQRGGCPIHGTTMSEMSNEQILMPCGHYENGKSIAKCARKSCDIKAYNNRDNKEINLKLLSEFAYLIE